MMWRHRQTRRGPHRLLLLVLLLRRVRARRRRRCCLRSGQSTALRCERQFPHAPHRIPISPHARLNLLQELLLRADHGAGPADAHPADRLARGESAVLHHVGADAGAGATEARLLAVGRDGRGVDVEVGSALRNECGRRQPPTTAAKGPRRRAHLAVHRDRAWANEGLEQRRERTVCASSGQAFVRPGTCVATGGLQRNRPTTLPLHQQRGHRCSPGVRSQMARKRCRMLSGGLDPSK